MSALSRLDARVKLAWLAVYTIAVLHARTGVPLVVFAAVAVVVAVAVRLPVRSMLAVLRPLAVIIVVTAVFQILSIQQGPVLASWGPILVTAGALESIVGMVVGLVCIMVASVALMRCTAPEELARAFGWALAPLRRIGVRTEGAAFSLSVALRFVPVLVGDYRLIRDAQKVRGADFGGSAGKRLAAHVRLFGPLVRSSFRRADALAEAAVSRGFGCGVATSLHRGRFGLAEAACLLSAVALAALAVLL